MINNLNLRESAKSSLDLIAIAYIYAKCDLTSLINFISLTETDLLLTN